MADIHSQEQISRSPRDFQKTRWSLIRKSTGTDAAGARAAMETLCQIYRPPILGYFRGLCGDPVKAEDLTQDLFHRILRLNSFSKADSGKGKLRSFLLDMARKLWINDFEQATAKKRGGGTQVESLDVMGDDENPGSPEPADDRTPDREYQRKWALTMLEFSSDLLREEYAAKGQDKEELYNLLRPMLGFTPQHESGYGVISKKTKVPVNTLKGMVRRLRERWRKILREQVAITLTEPTEQNIKEELWELQNLV